MPQPEDKRDRRLEQLVEQFDRQIDQPDDMIDSAELHGLSDEEVLELNRRLQCLELLDAARPSGVTNDPNQTTVVGAALPNFSTPVSSPLRIAPDLPHDSLPHIEGLQVISAIGGGGYGDVFLARDLAIDRFVAVKIPRLDRVPGKKQKERFLREAKAAAMLSHPAIVPLFQTIANDDGLCLIYAYAKGPTLAEWLASRSEPWAAKDAARLVARLAEAIQHAHSRGVIHRDLKPGNLLFWENLDADATIEQLVDQVCVADFGLARFTVGDSSITADGDILGTPSYMSPEQANAENADERSDVFSLGAILYELVTRQPPFARKTPLQTIRAIIGEPVRWPSSLAGKDSNDLRAICLRSLEKQAKHRYASAQELADDLQRFIGGEPIAARPPSRFERITKWYSRNPLLGTLTTALLLSLFLGIIASSIFGITSANNANLASQNEQKWQREAARAINHERQAIQERNHATELLRRARRRNYGHELSEAFRLVSIGFRSDAFDIIESSPIEYRNVEHDLVYSQLDVAPIEIEFERPLERCCISGDHRTLFTLHGLELQIHDLAGEAPASRIELREHPTRMVSNYDGGLFAMVLADGSLDVCDHKGDLRARLAPTESGTVDSMAFEPGDESLLLTISDGPSRSTLCRWVFASQPRLSELVDLDGQSLSILIDEASDLLMVSTMRSIQAFDRHNLTERFRQPFLAPSRPSLDLANRRLLVAHADRQISVVDIDTGSIGLTFQPHSSTCRVVSIPNSERIATWDEHGSFRIADAEFGESVLAIEASKEVLHECFFEPSTRRLVTVDQRRVRFFNCDSSYPHAKLDLQGNIRAIYKSTDEEQVIAFGANNRALNSTRISRLNWRTGENEVSHEIADTPRRLPAIDREENNLWLPISGGIGRISLTTDREALETYRFRIPGENFWQVVIDENEELLYAAGKLGVHRFRIDHSQELSSDQVYQSTIAESRLEQCSAMAVSHEARRLASGFFSGQVVIHDLDTAKVLHLESYFQDRAKAVVSQIRFSPDGSLVAINYSALGLVVLDATDEFRLIKRIENDGSVSAFSHDGRWLAVAARIPEQGYLIELYETQTFQRVGSVSAGLFDLRALQFSSDDQWLFSGSSSFVDAFRAWNVEQTLANLSPSTESD